MPETSSPPKPASVAAPTSDEASGNPFFEDEWSTPYGAPPFDRVDESHYGPAFDEAMKRQLAEIDAIAKNPEPATFANTIEAMEKSGRMLSRTASVFFNLAGSTSNDEIEKLRAEYAPKLSNHSDKIVLSDALFQRVDALHARKDTLGLDSDQLKLLTDTHRGFVRRGARLGPEDKKRMAALNERLATLLTTFGDRARKAIERYVLVIDSEEALAGLPPEVVAAGSALAERKGKPGKWAFGLVRSSITPFLQYADRRELRKEIYTAYTTRGAHGDDIDTRDVLKEIAVLRAQRAKLLGFETYAHYSLDGNMAKTPEAVKELLTKLWAGASAKVKEERDALAEMLRADLGPDAKLEPWDWWYYAEKVRKARYDLEQSELKPYFQVDSVRQGAFDTASRLFEITFEEVTERVPRYHDEVKAFDVKSADGSHVGLLYVDYHPRDGKRGGAWMNVFRSQNGLEKKRPLVVNVGNFPAPTPGKPALLGWDEVETLFHEFGHALHGLLSDVRYASLSGTNVKRDYVEFPSQLLENWAAEPSVIKKYARHYETNEPIPDVLIEKIEKAGNFNQGFAMTELVAAALLDLEWHLLDAEAAKQVEDVQAFDRAAMKKIGLIQEIAPRYHSPYFQHIFAGNGYAAGYYVYLWAQVLEADAYRAFLDKGDPFDPALAKKLRRYIFASGGSDDEMTLYGAFRGKPPTVDALLEKRELTVAD